jgi:excisionase family DNA binding protein
MSVSTLPNPTGRAAGKPWSVPETAQFLGVSERSIWRLIDAKEVKVTRLGRRVLVHDAEVRRLAGEAE